MESVYLDLSPHRVHTLRFGQGPELLIALHGFGDRARMFTVLDEALTEKYTVVAIDLPFHGQTEWKARSFSKEDLQALLRAILDREGFERFNLMGFSFGARLAQAMLPEFISQIDKLYLLSPDGINTKGMWMAVHTPMPLRRFLYNILENPDWFVRLTQFGRKIGVVPPLIHHFLTNNLVRTDRFQRSFGCWFALSSFYLRRRRIRALLRESNLPTDIYFGTNDDMIRFKTIKKMSEALPNARLFLLDEGHRIIGKSLAELMMSEE